MNSERYQQLLLAIQVNYGSCNAQKREEAFRFCEDFKVCIDSIAYAIELYHYSLSDPARDHNLQNVQRHFALHCIENYIRSYFSNLRIEEQKELRNRLLQLIFAQAPNDEPSYLREKKVVLLAEIVKRHFPQRWPDFLSEMLNFWKITCENALYVPLQRMEIILRSISSVIQDCIAQAFNSSIAATRRKEILQGMRVELHTFLMIVIKELHIWYACYKESGKDANVRVYCKQCILATLGLYSELYMWLPVETVWDTEFTMIIPVLELVMEEAFRIEALATLEMAVAQSFKQLHSDILIAFSSRLMEKLQRISFQVEQRHVMQMDEFRKELFYHTKVNTVLVQWAEHQLGVFGDILTNEHAKVEQKESVLRILQQFTDIFFRLYSHPSCLIAEMQLPVWEKIFKSPVLRETCSADKYTLQLQQLSFERYFKLGFPSRMDPERAFVYCFTPHPAVTNEPLPLLPSSLLSSLCSAEDFTDDDIFIPFHGNFRSGLSKLIKQIAESNALAIIKMASEILQAIFDRYKVGIDHLNSRNQCSLQSTAYLYHEGISSLIENITKILPPSAEADHDIQHYIKVIIELNLSFNTIDPLLMYRQLLTVAAFPKFYSTTIGLEILSPVLDFLFRHIQFLLPGEDIRIRNLSTETMDVRRCALASLVAVSQNMPAHLLWVLPALWHRAKELFASGTLLAAESAGLYELVTVVSNTTADVTGRLRFLLEITSELVEDWKSEPISALISSPEQLFAAVEVSHSNSQALLQLETLYKTLSCLHGIVKRATLSSFSVPHKKANRHSKERTENAIDKLATKNMDFSRTLLPLILPNLMALTRTLHSLRLPQFAAALSASSAARWLISLSVDEVAQLLSGKSQLDDALLKTLSPHIRWANWHKSLRETTYQFLGVILTNPVFYEFKLQDPHADFSIAHVFHDAIFVHWNTLDHYSFHYLIAYVFVPLVRHCPATKHNSLLKPVLRHIFLHLQDRFCYAFTDASKDLEQKAQWTLEFPGIDAIKQEAASESILHKLTRLCVEFFEQILDIKNHEPEDSDSNSILRHFILFECVEETGLLLNLLARVIAWKDSIACTKAVVIADKLVTWSSSHPAYASYFTQMIPIASLHALMDQTKDDRSKWEIVNLLRNIYCRMCIELQSDSAQQLKGILLTLPGVSAESLYQMHTYLMGKHSVKSQRNAMKELLGTAFQAPTVKMLLDLEEKLVICSTKKVLPVYHDTAILFMDS